MSNYLNRLVTRSLNPIEASVQPRLPSLFEPVTGVPPLGIVPLDSGEPEGTSALATREVASPRIPTPIEESQPAVRRSPSPLPSEPSHLEPRSTIDVSKLRFVPPPPTSSEPPTVAPQPAVPHPQPEQFPPADRVPHLAQAADSPEKPPASVRPMAIQQVVEQIFADRPENTDSTSVPAKAAVGAEDNPAPIAQRRSTPNEPPISPPALVRHAPPAIVKPQIYPLIEAIEATAVASPAPPQPAPTIQVTIGRIEVRATAPANPPSTRTRQQSPAMSLEEYLRQRGGGR